MFFSVINSNKKWKSKVKEHNHRPDLVHQKNSSICKKLLLKSLKSKFGADFRAIGVEVFIIALSLQDVGSRSVGRRRIPKSLLVTNHLDSRLKSE